MLFYKTKEEIELVRESSLLVAKTLAEVAKAIRPGITTLELDRIAEIQHPLPGFLKVALQAQAVSQIQ